MHPEEVECLPQQPPKAASRAHCHVLQASTAAMLGNIVVHERTQDCQGVNNTGNVWKRAIACNDIAAEFALRMQDADPCAIMTACTYLLCL